MKLEHEKTDEILKWFEEITKIPRCSKNEEKICDGIHIMAGGKEKAVPDILTAAGLI